MNHQMIGPYRILGILGEGGMGTVYEAEQDQPHRRVALKVIRPGFVSPELIRRFARESEVLGRLQHPGIAQIYEAGTSEGPQGPQPFFALELVRGQPLTEYAAAHALDRNQRLELFARVCDAVAYAHQQGVIHRDLKPANILVDASGQPKILDFGVARLTDADVHTRQTSVGEVIGTLQYMSPEQVNADPTDLDFRSDVYTLGVILFELLTGRVPYDLSRKMIHEAARIILIDDPVRLSTVNRRLAGDVEIIVGKTLEKEKERRYSSAGDLASDVRRFLRDEPIVARPTSALYQLRKFARRNRGLVAGLALAALLLVLGTGVSVWQAVRATAAEHGATAAEHLAVTRQGEAVRARELAERRRAIADSISLVADSARADALREQASATASAERAVGEAAKAQAVNDFLQKMLASSDPANALGKELSVRELLDQSATKMSAGDLTRQPEVRASVESTIGRTYFALGLYDAARPHFDSAYAIRARGQRSGSLDLAISASERGQLARATGDYVEAERLMRQALAGMRARLKPDDDQITAALSGLADIRYQRGKFGEAEALYREALRLARARHGDSAIEVADRLGSLGSFLSYTARAKEAKAPLEEALAIVRRTYGRLHPRVVNALVSLSDAQAYLPDYAGAEATLREALPIARVVFGPAHPEVANILGRLGSALMAQQKLAEAEPLLRDALAMRISLLGESHPDVQLARVELARLLVSRGRFGEADTLYNDALRARRSVLGDSSPAVASSLGDLGNLEMDRENWAAAEACFREAIPIWHAAKVESEEVYTWSQLALTLRQLGRLDEASTILSDVVKRNRALYGENHWTLGVNYQTMAEVATARGRPVEAESLSVLSLGIARAAYGAHSAQAADQLIRLANTIEARGDTARAIPVIRESLAMVAAVRPASDPNVVLRRRLLALDLCATGALVEGDSVIRTAIATAPSDSTQPVRYRVASGLGFCLMRQRRFAPAEAALLEAEAGLRRIGSTAAMRYRAQAMTWLVQLFDQTGKPDQAATWRRRLAGEP